MHIRLIREAAQKLGVSIRTLQRWISVGEGPAVVELGSRRKGILDDDLEGWVLSRRRAPPGEAALSKISAPVPVTSELYPQSDAPKKRGRPAGVKLVSVAPDCAEVVEVEPKAVSERDHHSDTPKKRGRPAGAKPVSAAPDCVEAAQPEREGA